ncbi:MAG TPA: ATP-binding protein [Sphingomicrobium sp.]|nr:ATP-binding protein [Sphingomicrobium sp.]
MLAILFLIAVWLDRSEPQRAVAGTYALLILYAAGAIGIAAATWRNWWLDARLAVPMHAIDMAIFTAIVFSTNGSTSPFFLFFVLPLLSAAIRWGWRETTLTATALVVLFLCAGVLLAGKQGWELERFVVRSGHLIILSLLLIWFGIHQPISRLFFRIEDFEPGLDQGQNPLAGALNLAVTVTRAGGGALLMAPAGEEATDGLSLSGGRQRPLSLVSPIVHHSSHAAFLYDVARNRVLARVPQGGFRFESASSLLAIDETRRIGLGEGLAAEVRTGTQHGWLLLWDIPDLSSDFIDFGRELGRAAGAILDRHALLQAIETGAAARTRLGLARDVHDSIVQFLAGAAFRVEAIKRAAASDGALRTELDELKRLLVEEQGEIRGFLLALRRDRELELADAVGELRVLAERLSQQWSVNCNVTADGDKASIPIRLQLDLQQMLREAVANAVRHGGADRVDVGLAVNDGRLQLSVADNGSGFARPKGAAAAEPRSLKERVERAHGSIRLDSEPGSTNILITLPLAGAAA